MLVAKRRVEMPVRMRLRCRGFSMQMLVVFAAGQAKSPDPVMSIRKAGPKRQFSATPGFRAEEFIPDICKGYSS
ncbi:MULTISPECIES: hypothetical protein [Bradyrhizobium]|uniref:Uncharacterized protein n=1 Tax=Bradyrhizobium quebecense TaxID=2748629 RepID=A0A939RPS5_9BRAD